MGERIKMENSLTPIFILYIKHQRVLKGHITFLEV